MFNPITISDFFLLNYGEENDITPMRLVKLVYISHGWYLGLTGKALIDENPEAWQYGPVIPTIYHHYKRFGSKPIKKTLIASDVREEIPSHIQSLLRKVWETYKEHTALGLSSLTHQPGTPWSMTWEKSAEQRSRYGGFALGIVSKQIPDNLIRDYYREKLGVRIDVSNRKKQTV